jgi:conjugal transfer pilus assembly protein TraF
MKDFLALFMLVLAATATQAQAPPAAAPGGRVSYWSDSRRGWHFYEEPPAESVKPVVPKDKAPPPSRKAPELAEFAHLQKQLEEYRSIAIIHPTEANVRRYMELEARIVGQASRFADMAQRVAWATPELDPSLQGRPVNAKALGVFEQDQLQARAQSVAELGRDHVLFFFFRGDCPYCHAFAPTLAAFQARHRLQVVGISLDGGALPDFPAPRRDNGIARTLNVSQVPAVFLAQPASGAIAPVGFGVLSESQLLERLAAIAAPPSVAIDPSNPSPQLPP